MIVRILPAFVVVWAAGGWLLLGLVERRLNADIDNDLITSAQRGVAILNNLPPDTLDGLFDGFGATLTDDVLVIIAPDGTTTAVPSGDATLS